MATWRELISKEMSEQGESFLDVDESTINSNQLDDEFYDGYGGSEGIPFTLWTHKRVYFPIVYDGREWVGSVSRNPDGVATEHFGGQ